MSEEMAIHARNLGHRYRRKWAVRHLTFQVSAGKVYGFLGLNGAGKTTTIRMLMGLIKRNEGVAEVLGQDPEREPVKVKATVGYVAETPAFYDWMTIGEIVGFVANYRADWDADLAEYLLKQFDLSPEPKISELSKGQRAKVALLLALGFKPKLLILDEPTTGLDPSARREFFESVLAGYQEEGGTIFVSSHLVNEISGIVDHIGLIEKGEMLLDMPVEELRASVKRIRLTFPQGAPGKDLVCPKLLRAKCNGREAVVSVRDFQESEEHILKVLKAYEPSDLQVEDLNLEDIFVELVGKKD